MHGYSYDAISYCEFTNHSHVLIVCSIATIFPPLSEWLDSALYYGAWGACIGFFFVHTHAPSHVCVFASSRKPS